MFNSQKKVVEVYPVSDVKTMLQQKEIVWAWVEPLVHKEWRRVIYDGDDLCLLQKPQTWYDKMFNPFYVDYSLIKHRRLPQDVKYFVLGKEKPNFVFVSGSSNCL